MKRTILVFVLLIPIFHVNCQDNLKNDLKVKLFSALDPVNSSVDLAYERFIKEKSSFQIGFGYLLPIGIRKNVGFKIRTEYRIYKSNSKGLYVAPELFYMKSNYESSGEFGVGNDSTGYNYSSSFKVDKQVLAVTGKIGYQINRGHICVDLFTGLGVRFRFVKHYGMLNPDDKLVSPIEPNIYYMTDSIYPVTINLSLNVSIGYRF